MVNVVEVVDVDIGFSIVSDVRAMPDEVSAMQNHEPTCPCCGAEGARMELGAEGARMDQGAARFGRRELVVGSASAAALLASASWLGAGSSRGAKSFAAMNPFAAGSAGVLAAPRIVTRAQWGANEKWRNDVPVFDATVEKLVVHHTVTPNGPRDVAAVIRNMYWYHTSRGYIDLAYNFVIDENGSIYEGRWAQNYASGGVHSTEDVQRRQVRSAHALYFNERTIGIALLGTFNSVSPPPQMLRSLVDLMAWKCSRWRINPVGSSAYTNTQLQRVVMPNIVGHRDVTQTLCPGDATRALLPSLRVRVQDRLAQSQRAYWVLARDGSVRSYGGAVAVPAQAMPAGGVIAGAVPSGRPGIWLLGPSGRVMNVAGAHSHGDLRRYQLHKPVVAIASSPSGHGYFIAGADGGVFCFGDAHFHGSLGGRHLRAAICSLAVLPDGRGYRLLSRDGAVFNFGIARAKPALGPFPHANPAVAMLGTTSGHGYWVVQRDGTLHGVGDARPRAWVHKPKGPVIALHRGGGGRGLIAMCRDGSFVNTVTAGALHSARASSIPYVAVVGSL